MIPEYMCCTANFTFAPKVATCICRSADLLRITSLKQLITKIYYSPEVPVVAHDGIVISDTQPRSIGCDERMLVLGLPRSPL